MIYLIPIFLLLAGCSLRNLVTPAASVGGAAVGGIAGPGGAALGAGVGYASGKIYELTEDKEELVEALTHGDVEGIVRANMADHASGFQEFTSYIKRILIGAAVLLGGYLMIPIFVARSCSKSEAQKHLTRPPFPTK